MPEALTTSFAAFIQHAWNPDARRFRNFMGFDRRWLEDRGSEDSNGRTLWALGECARSDASPLRRQWAAALFAQALQMAEDFRSPRAWAFTLLGLDAFGAADTQNPRVLPLRRLLADRLMRLLADNETNEWVWFEDVLAYDNARLPQSLIVTGLAINAPAYVAGGLRSLRWLMALQRTARGYFRPVGSESFGNRHRLPRSFDQQPLDAAASVSACLAAWRVESDPRWKADAQRAFDWFLGSNDLSTPLVDMETGACRDGLHPDRANENRGGESVVSYLLSLAELRALARLDGNRTKPTPVRVLRA